MRRSSTGFRLDHSACCERHRCRRRHAQVAQALVFDRWGACHRHALESRLRSRRAL